MAVLTLGMAVGAPAKAQAQASGTAAAPSALQPASGEDEEAELDFVVINTPTTLALPRHKANFRLTHRFAGNLRSGTFGQNAGNLFGLDQGAIIGLELRYAILPRVQAAMYRSSFDKTVQFYGKLDAIRQRRLVPVSVSALVSVEGTNNFQQNYAPALGVVLSRTILSRITAYASPVFVQNSAASLAAAHDHTGTTGCG